MLGLRRRTVVAQTLDPMNSLVVCSDRELLMQFVAGEERAFTLLVERHAGLVMGVCRRIVRQASDVEDAFQATFLVLARRARSLQWQESIAGWLHQTARRTALKLRSMAARQRRVEAQAARVPGDGHSAEDANPSSSVAMQELVELLDAELSKLPAKFREVIVLSQFEGLGREEMAERLGITAAAVKDRLERGKEQLRLRLVRRGVTFSVTALAAWLLPNSAHAAGQTALTVSTAHAGTVFATGVASVGNVPTAVVLAQGVLKMMGLEKLKSLALGLVSLLTVGSIAYGMLQDEPERFEKGLRGTIVAVNLSGTTPTVTVNLDFEVLLSLDIKPQAKVWTAFEPGKLTDLQEGRFVSLRLGSDHRTVEEVHVLGAQREVTIRSVGPSGSITVVPADHDEDEDENGEQSAITPEEVQLAPDAILRIGGLPATRDDLKPGMTVPLEFCGNGKTVNAIEAESDPEMLIDGEIVALDAVNATLTLRTEMEDDVTAKFTLKVLPETLILLDGQPAKFTALMTGSEITVRLDDTKNTIRALRAASPVIEPNDDADENETEDDAAGEANDVAAEGNDK